MSSNYLICFIYSKNCKIARHFWKVTVISLLGQLRKQWPVLQTGHVRLTYDSDAVVVIERFLDLGRDAFGHFVEGPERVRVAINRSPHPVPVPWSSNGDQLLAYGGILQAGATEIRTELETW